MKKPITVSLNDLLRVGCRSESFLIALHLRGKIVLPNSPWWFNKTGYPFLSRDLPSYLTDLADDEQFSASILATPDSAASVDHALWCAPAHPEHRSLWRKYAVWCVRQAARNTTVDAGIPAGLSVAWQHACGGSSEAELVEAERVVWAVAYDASSEPESVEFTIAGAAGNALEAGIERTVSTASYLAALAAYRAQDQGGNGLQRGEQAEKLRQILDAGEWVD